MNDEELLEIVGFVKVSDYRLKTLKFIGNGLKMPKEIGNELNIRTSHASNVLKALKKYNLVVCTNPNNTKGRLYKNTDLAFKVMEYLD